MPRCTAGCGAVARISIDISSHLKRRVYELAVVYVDTTMYVFRNDGWNVYLVAFARHCHNNWLESLAAEGTDCIADDTKCNNLTSLQKSVQNIKDQGGALQGEASQL